jgi:uncharacterized protein
MSFLIQKRSLRLKTNLKIPVESLQLLLVLVLLLGTQVAVKADEDIYGTQGMFAEGVAAYEAGDYKEALLIFQVLAEQGHALAQYNLGIIYSNGKAVPKDYRMTAKWYRKAAEQGISDAQYRLGIAYNLGLGVPEDSSEAVKWYRKAAEQNNALAQLSLGVMYQKGLGLPQDYVLAHKWFNLSASRLKGESYDFAVKYRSEVERAMTVTQIGEAQKLAREWKPKTWKELSQQN